MSPLSYSIFLLRSLGVWYSDGWLTGWKAIVYSGYTAFILFTVYTFTLSHILTLYECFDSANEFADRSFMMFTLLTMCGKMMNVIVKRKVLAKMMNDLQTDPFYPQDPTEFTIHRESNRYAKFYTLMYGLMTDSTCTMLVVVSLSRDIPRRQLPYKALLPFNTTIPTAYWVVYFQQTVGLYISTHMNIAFDTLVVGMMMLTCTQLKIFKHRFEKMHRTLENIGDSLKDTFLVQERLRMEKELFANCIKHHSAILQFAEQSNNIFAVTVFFQYCSSSLVLCVSTYCLSRMEPFTQEFFSLVMYLTCVLIQIFNYCRYATEVELESEKITNAIYATDWTSLTVNTQKNLVLIMARVLRPLRYKSGHITLSLESFCNLLKLNYSAYNVLQRSD